MTYEERKNWILAYIRKEGDVGISNLDFMEAFSLKFFSELEHVRRPDAVAMRVIYRMYREGILYRRQFNFQGYETASGYGAHSYMYGLKE